jgi:hypothetical protein
MRSHQYNVVPHRVDPGNRVQACWPRPDVEYGHRVCRTYETYVLLHPSPVLSFEWTWNLLRSISMDDELYLAQCHTCRSLYIQDAG